MKKFILQKDYEIASNFFVPKGSVVDVVPAKAIDKKIPKDEKQYWDKRSWEEALYIVFMVPTYGLLSEKFSSDVRNEDINVIAVDAISSVCLANYFEEVGIELVEVQTND